jgi:hypothetical protein
MVVMNTLVMSLPVLTEEPVSNRLALLTVPQMRFEGHTPNVVGFLALRAFLPPRRMAIDCE